jgi:hypothetical protein
VGSGLGPDLIGHGAPLPNLLFGFDVADRLAVGIAQLVRGAACQHGPGPLDQLAGDRDAGLGVAMTLLGHQPVVEPGQLRILPPSRVRGLEEREPQHRRPFLSDRSAGLADRA